MLSTERKPNFELSSLLSAISAPVHYDTGKFQHSCKATNLASPQFIFLMHSSQVIKNISGIIETNGSWWAHTPLTFFFPPKPKQYLVCQVNLTLKASIAVVETSVANNSPSQDSNYPDDHFQSRYVSPGFKPFSYLAVTFISPFT